MSVLLTWPATTVDRDIIGRTWPAELNLVHLHELDQDHLTVALSEVRAIVGQASGIPRELFDRAPRLQLVHTMGHGVDSLMLARNTLKERNIALARANSSDVGIAEYVLMSLIALSRCVIPVHNRLAMFGDWSETALPRSSRGLGELSGSTLGLVGYGAIAQQVHRRAAAFDMTIGLVSRDPARHVGQGLDFVDRWDAMDAFLGKCDYVVLALPLTSETQHLIDARRLSAMKRGSYLVNISRGGLIREDDLYQALASGHLAGAALDVFETEKHGQGGYPTERPMHQFNVVLTPHYSGRTAGSRRRALEVVGENLRRMLDGTPIRNLVDYDSGY